MEGVGARFGRQSTRHGLTSTVFTGPVRKWKKKWVHVSPPKYTSTNTTTTNSVNNSAVNSNGPSNLLFYKWAPINTTNNNNNNNNNNNSNNNNISNNNKGGEKEEEEEDDVVSEPPRRKFRYVPVALLEEQQIEAAENEAEEKVEDEAKPEDANLDAVGPASKKDVLDEKPDINDVPMEEDQVALLEEQQIEAAVKEAEEKVEDEAKPDDTNLDAVKPLSKNDVLDEKPDINDTPMEEDQDADEAPSTRHDLNKNLSFNLNSKDDDPDSDTNADEN